MKTFLADIIPKIQKYSKRLDDLAMLTNQHWIFLGEIIDTKTVYIFRPNNQLLISENGIVNKCNWEYVGTDAILLDLKDKSLLFKHGFFDENIMAFKLDSTEQFAFFINETKYGKEINNIHDVLLFLERKYLKKEKSNLENNQRSYNNLGGFGVPNYSENEPIEQFEIFGARYFTVYIYFENSFSDMYRFYPKKDMYGFQKNNVGEVYFEDKNACIRALFLDRMEHKN